MSSDSVIVSGADRKGPSWIIDHPFNTFLSPDSVIDTVQIFHDRQEARLWMVPLAIKVTYDRALQIVAEWRRRRAMRLMYK